MFHGEHSHLEGINDSLREQFGHCHAHQILISQSLVLNAATTLRFPETHFLGRFGKSSSIRNTVRFALHTQYRLNTQALPHLLIKFLQMR